MIRTIVRDPLLLQMKARKASSNDIALACDMADTLDANRENCAGIAANMVGENVAIICVMIGSVCTLFFNPEIIEKKEPYDAMEGCLSLDGLRKAKRYQKITLRFQDMYMQWHTMTYNGFTAVVIQHECDHLQGILI